MIEDKPEKFYFLEKEWNQRLKDKSELKGNDVVWVSASRSVS